MEKLLPAPFALPGLPPIQPITLQPPLNRLQEACQAPASDEGCQIHVLVIQARLEHATIRKDSNRARDATLAIPIGREREELDDQGISQGQAIQPLRGDGVPGITGSGNPTTVKHHRLTPIRRGLLIKGMARMAPATPPIRVAQPAPPIQSARPAT